MTSIRTTLEPVDSEMPDTLPDIKPCSPIRTLDRRKIATSHLEFPIRDVSVAVGMSESFIGKVCGKKKVLSGKDILALLDQDAFRETIVPRSMIMEHLVRKSEAPPRPNIPIDLVRCRLIEGDALDILPSLPSASVRCVVTSTPYWAMRLYKECKYTKWSDGEICPFGHEQTPEAFARHTTEVLAAIHDVLAEDGSVWWNVMDTFNTRTQIRGNAAEALRAMQGKDSRSWTEHACRRYSAGHSYLKDGEQCLIPGMIAERASRIGYYVKSVITWAKTSTLPEPQNSRVSRSIEYVLHLTRQRTPFFDKGAYRSLPAMLGGRNNDWETDKLSDVWALPTSTGRDGHGAQFPLALPGRCIALSTKPGDIVLDPFVGAGNSGVASVALGRKFIGIDISKEYLAVAGDKISVADNEEISNFKYHQTAERGYARRLL